MFSAACRDKQGRYWCIHIPVETWEDAENIVKQLGLDVDLDNGLGELIEQGPISDLTEEELATIIPIADNGQIESQYFSDEDFEAVYEPDESPLKLH